MSLMLLRLLVCFELKINKYINSCEIQRSRKTANETNKARVKMG